jgi:hypothetical protein
MGSWCRLGGLHCSGSASTDQGEVSSHPRQGAGEMSLDRPEGALAATRSRGNYEFPRRSGACFLKDSAIRVCHPVPLAFQRSKTSGATLKLIATFEFGDLGRPRGLSISAAVLVPYRLGNTSRAGRAREKSSFVHSGFSSLTRDFLFFLITSDLTPIRLAQADHVNIAATRREHEHVQPTADFSECLKSGLTVVSTNVFQHVCAAPLEAAHQLEGQTTFSYVSGALFWRRRSRGNRQ